MNRSIIIVIFFLITFSQAVYATNTCIDAFALDHRSKNIVLNIALSQIPVHQGLRTNPLKSQKQLTRKKVSLTTLLGVGQFGGKVYRVAFADGSFATYKKYTRSAVLRIDLQKMKFWKDYEQELPIRVAAYNHPIKDLKYVQVENVFGSTVKSLLENPNVPDKIKYQVREKYREIFFKIHRWASRHSEQVERVALIRNGYQGYDLLGIVLKNNQTLWLHPDNIVIDAFTGEFVLIDPA
ncbi:MAG: hypothetical protein KDD50_07215 [Bdellovibrionales bacterium]|nr:hypothetical protein [Bdellovibrionales bacterium]